MDNICEILKEFEERANNRICKDCHDQLVKATRELLKSNGMLAEVDKALTLEWEEDDESDDESDDDLLELVSEDGFGYDGVYSGGLNSGGGEDI